MPESELEKCINGKSLNVNIINPPIEKPWATRQDYLDDQKRINTAQRWTICAALAAIITALCSVVAIGWDINQKAQQQAKPSQLQECPSKQP